MQSFKVEFTLPGSVLPSSQSISLERCQDVLLQLQRPALEPKEKNEIELLGKTYLFFKKRGDKWFYLKKRSYGH